MTKVIFRERVSTVRELAEVLIKVDQTFSRTQDKYLEVNGDYVVSVEVHEKTLSDKSIVHDVVLVTELNANVDMGL